MSDFDWKKLVGTVAPALATAFGGPLAGVATQAVSTALLGKPDAKEAEIAAALSSGGADALLKLKQADQEFVIKMREMDIDLEKISASDRDSARQRAVKQNDLSPNWIGVFILLIWATINIYLLTTNHPPVISEMMQGRILGMIDASTLSFLYYIYGTSAGSDRKNQTIDNLLDAKS